MSPTQERAVELRTYKRILRMIELRRRRSARAVKSLRNKPRGNEGAKIDWEVDYMIGNERGMSCVEDMLRGRIKKMEAAIISPI